MIRDCPFLAARSSVRSSRSELAEGPEENTAEESRNLEFLSKDVIMSEGGIRLVDEQSEHEQRF